MQLFIPTALEHIKEEIKAFRPAEWYDLWSELSREFDPVTDVEGDEESVEAAWEGEIDARVREVQEGKVQLISAEESERLIRARLAELRGGPKCKFKHLGEPAPSRRDGSDIGSFKPVVSLRSTTGLSSLRHDELL